MELTSHLSLARMQVLFGGSLSAALSTPAPYHSLPKAAQWSACDHCSGVVFPQLFWPSLQGNSSLFYLPLCTAIEEPRYYARLKERLNRVPAHVFAWCGALA